MTYTDLIYTFVDLIDELNYISEETWQCEFGNEVDIYTATFSWFDSIIDDLNN